MAIANAILTLNSQGDQVKAAQANLAKVGVAIPTTETSASVFGAGTADAVKQFQIASKLPPTGMVDAATQTMLNNAAAAAAASQASMSGQITQIGRASCRERV